MDTKKWMQIPPTDIKIDLIVPTQTHLYDDINKIPLFNCGDEYIHVVLYEGIYFLSDGHHRLDKFKKEGKSIVKARLYIKNAKV